MLIDVILHVDINWCCFVFHVTIAFTLAPAMTSEIRTKIRPGQLVVFSNNQSCSKWKVDEIPLQSYLISIGKSIFVIHKAQNAFSSYLLDFKGSVDLLVSSRGLPWFNPAAMRFAFAMLSWTITTLWVTSSVTMRDLAYLNRSTTLGLLFNLITKQWYLFHYITFLIGLLIQGQEMLNFIWWWVINTSCMIQCIQD